MTESGARTPEPEYMDDRAEAEAYAAADFSGVNAAFAERLAELAVAIDNAEALDLGTGPADIPIRVARLKPGWRITAVDAAVIGTDEGVGQPGDVTPVRVDEALEGRQAHDRTTPRPWDV